MATFHRKTGTFISLSNNNTSASRNNPTTEFNNGVIMSNEPLCDDVLFEVRINKKVNSWSGSIEIGVTTCDPSTFTFPSSATGFREGTWVMLGSSILKDGQSIVEEYGQDLDQLNEMDTVGILRTSSGSLHFYINGIDQGSAASNLPNKIYAVIDLYGKCSEVSLVRDNSQHGGSSPCGAGQLSNEMANMEIAEQESSVVMMMTSPLPSLPSNEHLVFHERIGSLIKLSNNRRTAERRRPLDEFNNGVIMTNRPISDDQLFEIRLDRLVDKWSGSIEVGLTTHNPGNLDFPATMTNIRSGTIMMSGCGILTNGKGTRREYGEYNLDELMEGDRIGMIRKSNGCLHYYINGVDQGVASTETPKTAWAVVDLYGMAVKVTILDCLRPQTQPESVRGQRANNIIRQFRDTIFADELEDEQQRDRLTFHSNCANHCALTNGHMTAFRPNPLEDFNFGIAMTNRCLRANETFRVRLDSTVDKWSGSLEIGVTEHPPQDFEFPCTMTNMRSGTWMLSGSGIMHNGNPLNEDFASESQQFQQPDKLSKLKVGDVIGVTRREDGTLHFSLNDRELAIEAGNVPENVYGVIDIYGQASQASIVNDVDVCRNSHHVSSEDELRFHRRHGRNACISNGGRTAIRPNARGEFNDAILMSNRPLKDNELFEVMIENMVDRWSGSIEAGLTTIKPEDIEFPSTMTDIDFQTWMLSGSAIMQDGFTIKNTYTCDLDKLSLNSRIGMVRSVEGNLHFYINGEDMGVACYNIPQNVYAVIDLYGQCAQVSITSGGHVHMAVADHLHHGSAAHEARPRPTTNESLTQTPDSTNHRFSQRCGVNIALKNNASSAERTKSFNHGLVFSADPLKSGEMFEVRVERLASQWSGSLAIGLTSMISDNTAVDHLPSSASANDFNDFTSRPSSKTIWMVCDCQVKKNAGIICENYAPSLQRLQVGNLVGVKRGVDNTMHIYLNGRDLGVAACDIPKNVFAVIDVYGMVEAITVTSSPLKDMVSQLLEYSTPSHVIRSTSTESLQGDDHDNDNDKREGDKDTSVKSFIFHESHGKNIKLFNAGLTAQRMASYNEAIVFSNRHLQSNSVFQVKIDRLNENWSSSLMIGVVECCLVDVDQLPISAIDVTKKVCCILQADSVYYSGVKVKDYFGANMDTLAVGDVVGVSLDEDRQLHVYINGCDKGVAAKDVPPHCFAIIDLYGQCDQVTILTDEALSMPKTDSSFNSCEVSSKVECSDYREKVDSEDGMKEKMYESPLNDISRESSKCDYQSACERFKSLLGLPEAYFDSTHNRCYCEACYKLRGDELYYKRGDPLKDYAIPIGWCRFALRVHQRARVLNVFERWHVAFHGTRVEAVRRILDCGDLLMPGDTALGGFQLRPPVGHFDEKHKPDGFDIQQIFLSPTIKYSGQQVYAHKHEFKDPKTSKLLFGRIAFQVWVKPGSYKIGAQTIGANEQLDLQFDNSELEWSTKERGATILYGLLIKIE